MEPFKIYICKTFSLRHSLNRVLLLHITWNKMSYLYFSIERKLIWWRAKENLANIILDTVIVCTYILYVN